VAFQTLKSADAAQAGVLTAAKRRPNCALHLALVVLWWRPEAWGPVGQFGSVFELDDALAFIAEESTFWIRT
jgi:hypothetical protein